MLAKGLAGPVGPAEEDPLVHLKMPEAVALLERVDSAALGQAVKRVVAAGLAALKTIRRPDRTRASKADEFRFGDYTTFTDGVSGLVGPPANVAGTVSFVSQFLAAMAAEHTAVADHDWGGSGTEFEPPPHYSWKTSPRSEWAFVLPERDEDYTAEFGGYTADGAAEFREPLQVRRPF